MELHLGAMENVSCWAFRKLCTGATDSYTGMMSISYLTKRTKAWREVDTFLIGGQRQWLQLLTSKEKEIPEFLSRLNKELKEDEAKNNLYGLQLNLSCPSPNICNVGQGAALIKRPTKVANLIKELLKQERFKVGVKMRLGLNPLEVKQGKTISLLSELEKIKDKNFSNVVVHFKHAKERSSSAYDYSSLNEIAEADFKLPIVINGGISSLNDFNKIIKSVKNKKNIAGFMMAREALKNPNCFIEPSNSLNGTTFDGRSLEEINSEFNSLIKEHQPLDIYLRTIKEFCEWRKN